MASNFMDHHSAAATAFKAGNHSLTAHHVGHMLMAVKNQMKGATTTLKHTPPKTPATTTGMPSAPATQAMGDPQAGNDDMDGDEPTQQGIATPISTPASGGRFFGEFGKSTPKPQSAPSTQLGSAKYTPSGGVNKTRFTKK